MSLKENRSVIQTNTSPNFEALELEGWYGASLEDAGLFTLIFKIDANAPSYPFHSAPASWLTYVISGSGKLYCGDQQGKQTTYTDYSQGDFITFQPGTPHGRKNGNTQCKPLLIKRAHT